jgi:tRNA-Thr(GGU) m(6)t(6)A37 methyltransferase TsaA
MLPPEAPAHDFVLRPIGYVRSPLQSRGEAPRQGSEGAPDAWLELNEGVLAGIDGIAKGQEIIVLTWLHQAQRDVLTVHPRNDPTFPLSGVFATRSPDRPNPIGLHRVRIAELAGARIKVGPLEAIDGTPIVDIKPVLAVGDR